MTDRMCKVIVNDTGDIQYESAVSNGSTLEQIIKDDKKYGVMTPRNGEYFTVRVADWKNRWMSSRQVIKGILLAWNTVEKIIAIDVRLAKDDETPDFTIFFRATADDPNLTSNTLMYHYYPISSLSNPNRGVCVVNTDFPWTIDGEGISLHEFDPDHYPEPTPNQTAKTYDFDDIYVHEGPGHGLGLPHSPNRYTKMFYNAGGMIDFIFNEKPRETIARLQAKYPKRRMSIWHLGRWIRYLTRRRDRY